MAKAKPAPAVVSTDEGFTKFDADIEVGTAPEVAVDPKGAEIAALKARVAELEAVPAMPAGRYRVSLEDGPTAVVECEGHEHPYEAYKRKTGVRSSQHSPEVERVSLDTPLGIVRPSIA